METNQINKLKRQQFYTICFALFLVFIGIWSGTNNLRHKLAMQQAQTQGLLEGMKQYRNVLGQQITERKTLQIDYKALKNLSVSDSTEIAQLKKLVTKRTQSALIYTVVTTQTVAGASTVIPNEAEPCKPTYISHQITPWSEHLVQASADTTKIKCLVTNEFEFTDTWKTSGTIFNRKRTLITYAKNKNPNTLTKGLLSYSRPVEQRKIWPYIVGAFVTGATTTLLLLK